MKQQTQDTRGHRWPVRMGSSLAESHHLLQGCPASTWGSHWNAPLALPHSSLMGPGPHQVRGPEELSGLPGLSTLNPLRIKFLP